MRIIVRINGNFQYGAMAQIRQEAEHAKAATYNTYNNEAGDGKSDKEDEAIPF